MLICSFWQNIVGDNGLLLPRIYLFLISYVLQQFLISLVRLFSSYSEFLLFFLIDDCVFTKKNKKGRRKEVEGHWYPIDYSFTSTLANICCPNPANTSNTFFPLNTVTRSGLFRCALPEFGVVSFFGKPNKPDEVSPYVHNP